MMTRYNRMLRAALLAAVLLLTAAGCAAERPGSGVPDRARTGTLHLLVDPEDDPSVQSSKDPEAKPSTDPDAESSTDPEAQPSMDPEAQPSTDPDAESSKDPENNPSVQLPGNPEGELPGAELILAAGAQTISLVEGTAIEEGKAPVLTVTLTGLQFVDGPGFSKSGFILLNLPDGLDYTVERVDGATAKITLTGTPAKAVKSTALSLTIRKEQLQPRPDRDITADGAVTVEVAAKSGFPVLIAAAGGAAAAALIAMIAVAVHTSRKKKAGDQRQSPSSADIAETELLVQEPEKPDAPRQQGGQYAAPAASARQGAMAGTQKFPGAVQIGRLHNIGRRSSQQDSLGSVNLSGGSGVFAVVADGMGGLSGGDQVSQGIVMSMLRQAGALRPGQMDGELSSMVRTANEEINRKLGPGGIYRSGSTVVAVLLRGNALHWISVGDSRIYLYRGGGMIQLNREHNYAVELIQLVTNGEVTAAEAASDPQRHGLTSFIGMGRLKYVDASLRPIALQSGDRILLMTDGVFNNLPESAMADTLGRNPDVQQAAKILEEQVLALQDPAQDNFTAIILGFQG